MYKRLYPLKSLSSEKKYEVSISEELSDSDQDTVGPANIVLYSGRAIADMPVVISGFTGYEADAKSEIPGTKIFFADGTIKSICPGFSASGF